MLSNLIYLKWILYYPCALSSRKGYSLLDYKSKMVYIPLFSHSKNFKGLNNFNIFYFFKDLTQCNSIKLRGIDGNLSKLELIQ